MKNKDISISYKIYFIACVLIVLVCSIIQNKSIIVIVTTICEVLYMLFNIKRIKHCFLFGIINSIACSIVYIVNKNYGSACYNLLFILPIFIYGYYKVLKEKEYKINKLDYNSRLYITSVFITLVVGTAIILKMFGGRYVLFDSITMIGSFFAVLLVSFRYVEQWPLLILINISLAINWSIFTFENMINLPTLIIFIIYSINSIYGQVEWCKALHNQNDML